MPRHRGQPPVLEERFLSLVETGALSRYETAWHLDRTLSGEVPEALERLFRSRVDRLTIDARDAVVAASVLGPEFGAGALRAVTDLNGGLASAVSELCSVGLLVQVRKEPEPSYRFRHSLIQEATYRGLLREQRQRLHRRAAWPWRAMGRASRRGGGYAGPPFRHGRRARAGGALP